MFDLSTLTKGQKAGIGGGIGGLIGSLFGDDGSDAFADEMEKAIREGRLTTDEANKLLDPFKKAGLGQLGFLQDYINQSKDPGAVYNKLMSGYEESPLAKIQQEQSKDAALAGASASGMLGSTSMMNDIQNRAQQISSQDQGNYLQNLLGIRNQGAGMASNLYGQGLGAAGQQSSNLANFVRSMMEARGGIGQARQMGAQSGNNFMSGIGSIAGMLAFL